MKKISATLLALCMCLTLCISLSSCSTLTESHMGFKVISTDINDFNLEVPSEWTVTSQNGIVSATADGASDDESNISVMSTELNGTFETESEYFEGLIESYGELYDNVSVESRDVEVTFGGESGMKYVFTADVLGDSYKFMQVLCIHSNRLYIFTYTSNAAYYETHATEVEYIISYFSFKA